VVTLRTSGVPVLGFTWFSLTDQFDWQHALREERNELHPVGLFDLARRERPVGAAYRGWSRRSAPSGRSTAASGTRVAPRDAMSAPDGERARGASPGPVRVRWWRAARYCPVAVNCVETPGADDRRRERVDARVRAQAPRRQLRHAVRVGLHRDSRRRTDSPARRRSG
jgi:hypothetical protein